jgi:uncharacterized membrane protein YphA (DoxX/SURF4 family)
MANEVAHAELEIDAAEAEQMNEAMDYAQHRATWDGFTNLVKWAVIQLGFIVVGLYFIIFGGAALVGGLLILIGLLAPIGAGMFRALR